MSDYRDQSLGTGGALALVAATPAAVLALSLLALIWTPAVWLLAGGVAAIYGAMAIATTDSRQRRANSQQRTASRKGRAA